jgi:hypothetical protein
MLLDCVLQVGPTEEEEADLWALGSDHASGSRLAMAGAASLTVATQTMADLSGSAEGGGQYAEGTWQQLSFLFRFQFGVFNVWMKWQEGKPKARPRPLRVLASPLCSTQWGPTAQYS